MATRTITQTRTRTSTSTQAQDPPPDDGQYRFNFGAHRGLTLSEAPASYLRWIVNNPSVYESRADLRKALEEGGYLKAGQKKTGKDGGGGATKRKGGDLKAGQKKTGKDGGGGATWVRRIGTALSQQSRRGRAGPGSHSTLHKATCEPQSRLDLALPNTSRLLVASLDDDMQHVLPSNFPGPTPTWLAFNRRQRSFAVLYKMR